MIGLVIVTHGRLAEELKLAAEHVVGAMPNLSTVCIGPDDDLEQARNVIRDAIGQVNTGAGAVVLTDMFGGTPSNLAISLLDHENIEVVAGANLPMMIKLFEARNDSTLLEAAQTAKAAGRRYIGVASEIIAGVVDE